MIFGAGQILLDEPTTAPGNCAGCGNVFPYGFRRYRYNLCNACLKPGRFVEQANGILKKSFKSRKVGK